MKNHLVYLLLIFTSLARADESRDELIVQTVLKLESFNYDESSDKVKASINRYLDRNLGKGDYFILVEKFSINSLKILYQFNSALRCRNTDPKPTAALSIKTNSLGG